jgi:1,4-dihydroxy-2-naphthoyl-CoA hydrolase
MHQFTSSSSVRADPRRRARTGVLRHQVTGRAGSDMLSRPGLHTGLQGFLGFTVRRQTFGLVEARLPLREELMLGEGSYLHAGTVVAFADSCAGWGCWKSLPADRGGFTTSELKVNLVGTTRMPDALICVAQMLHGGSSTQVWDATVTRESDGREVGHFRCTQHLLATQR